ncbi:hypothetical protein O9993_19225 [Vibrio lentus]|nr:hypothetical protein [Vibrio lentus]
MTGPSGSGKSAMLKSFQGCN